MICPDLIPVHLRTWVDIGVYEAFSSEVDGERGCLVNNVMGTV